jgi:hypothetical protein
MSDVWYYSDDSGKQVGPLSLDDLRTALRTIPKRKPIFIWRAGFANWRPVSDVPEIFDAAPPPLPKNLRRPSLSRQTIVALLVIVGLFLLFRASDDPKTPSPESKGIASNRPPLTVQAVPVNPAEFARSAINEPNANVQTSINNGTLVVEYSLKPWALTNWTTKSGFEVHVKAIVPETFKRFPEIAAVQIVGDGPFVDKKGNQSVERAMMVKFSRSNSASINWDNVSYSNIVEIADDHWVHPALK